jgi:hypothetical protein
LMGLFRIRVGNASRAAESLEEGVRPWPGSLFPLSACFKIGRGPAAQDFAQGRARVREFSRPGDRAIRVNPITPSFSCLHFSDGFRSLFGLRQKYGGRKIKMELFFGPPTRW